MKVEFLKDWEGTQEGEVLDMDEGLITASDLLRRGIVAKVETDEATELIVNRQKVKEQEEEIAYLKEQLKQQRPDKDKMVTGAQNKLLKKAQTK